MLGDLSLPGSALDTQAARAPQCYSPSPLRLPPLLLNLSLSDPAGKVLQTLAASKLVKMNSQVASSWGMWTQSDEVTRRNAFIFVLVPFLILSDLGVCFI